jgi:hypothetical protein
VAAGQDAENAFTFGHDAMRRGWAGAAACVFHRIENDRRRSKEERSPGKGRLIMNMTLLASIAALTGATALAGCASAGYSPPQPLPAGMSRCPTGEVWMCSWYPSRLPMEDPPFCMCQDVGRIQR